MINENEIAKLSFPEAPKLVTSDMPGPKTQEVLKESHQYESMARGAGSYPFVFDEGLGATVKDPDGNIFIDISAGVAVSSVGRRHPEVVKAITQQSKKLLHAADMSNTRRAELARRISMIMPGELKDNCITYFTQSGSGAVETAIKFVRKMTGRNQIVAFHGGYHGVWCGSGSLTTGDQYRIGYGPHLPGVIHVPYPYCYRCCFGMEYPSCDLQCAKYVDYVLNTPYTGADDVGALIFEPQQGEGGYLVPPQGYTEIVKKACEKHGALFIADEVQAGAGRSGRMWSIEHTDVVPDLLTWGKGMGGDVPMAGLSMRKDLAEKIVESTQPNTFAGNALSAAVTITNINLLTSDNNALITRAGAMGEEIKKWLQETKEQTGLVGEIRGRGMFIGIEMVKDTQTKEPLDKETILKIIVNMLNRGVILVPCGRYGNVFRFMPPLVLSREQAQRTVELLTESINNAKK